MLVAWRGVLIRRLGMVPSDRLIGAQPVHVGTMRVVRGPASRLGCDTVTESTLGLRTDILDVAAGLLTRHDVRGFILPANTGATARAFLDRFGPDYEYFAVGNPASSHAKGYVYHAGMDDATQAELESLGFHLVLQEVSAFQPAEGSATFADHVAQMQASYESSLGGVPVEVHGTPFPMLIERVVRGLLDEQVKTCVEITLMAGESDAIDPDAKYIAVATPSRWSDFRDCAVVIRPSTVATFFQHPPFIYDIARSAKPGGGDGASPA